MTAENKNTLSNKYKEYLSLQQKITERQQLWLNDLQPKLIKVLNELVESNKMNAKVEVEENATNMQPVYITLGTADSGIAKIEGEEIEVPFPKEKGALLFSPIYNGKISTMIKYPNIKGLMQAKAPKMLELMEPEEMNEEKIEDLLIKFFQEVMDWENQFNLNNNPIGF